MNIRTALYFIKKKVFQQHFVSALKILEIHEISKPIESNRKAGDVVKSIKLAAFRQTLTICLNYFFSVK